MIAVLTLALIILAIIVFKLNRRVAALEKSFSLSEPLPPTPASAKTSEVAVALATDETETIAADLLAPDDAEEHKSVEDRSPWGSKRQTHQVTPTETEINASQPPKAYVFRMDVFSSAMRWVAQNWFLAIAAVSLALAGVFLVQYGVESGLLTPFWRVAGAAALGIALIVAGEILRRKWGDEEGAHTAYLPSTFAGAGLVALYAAVISARQLYGMTGAGVAFTEMVAVSLLAVVFGWFYGPFLAIVGILGATASPFVVGGSSDTPELFFYYFAVVALSGLLVDALRRWAWTSVLGLLSAHGAAWYIFDAGAGDLHYLVFAFIVALGAILIPPMALTPTHSGAMVMRRPINRENPAVRAEFPTRLAFGGFSAAVVIAFLVGVKDFGTLEMWSVFALLTALFLVATVWNRDAPALTDLSLLAPVVFLYLIYAQGIGGGTIAKAFEAVLPPESHWPKHVTVLSLIAAGVSAISFWRSQSADKYRSEWTAGAATFAPITLVIFEIWWHPSVMISEGIWAFHAMAIAGMMAFFAQRSGRLDRDSRLRAGIFALSALTMISFALILMLSETALTLALTVMVLGAVVLDRWQKLSALMIFIQVGLGVVTWRLVLDPGMIWAIDAPLWEIWLVNAPVVLQLVAAWYLLDKANHPKTRAALETALSLLLTVFALVLVVRALDNDLETHWGIGMCLTLGLVAMSGQLYLLKSSTGLRWVYWMTSAFYALLSMVAGFVLSVVFNPLASSNETVLGPLLLDTLMLAYGPIALVLAIVAREFDHLPRRLRLIFGWVSAITVTYYVALEIRRFWRGDVLAVPGTTDPELYSYTVALLLSAVVALFVAFSRRSVMLRRIAVFGIGLTIAKVFLIDMAGLAGLVRVASFLGLGLSLAGLAWINRRMTEQWDDKLPSSPEEPSTE